MANKEKKFSLVLNKKFDYSILIITLLLLSIGLIMLLSASAPTSLSETGDNSYQYVTKQGIMAIAGLFAMIVFSKFDYRIFKKFKWLIYAVCIAFLVAVGFVGTGAGGARRWINIAGFSFQPSEFAKVGFILFFAALLTELREKNKIIYKSE